MAQGSPEVGAALQLCRMARWVSLCHGITHTSRGCAAMGLCLLPAVQGHRGACGDEGGRCGNSMLGFPCPWLYHLPGLCLPAVVPSGGVGRWREQICFLPACPWWGRLQGLVHPGCVLNVCRPRHAPLLHRWAESVCVCGPYALGPQEELMGTGGMPVTCGTGRDAGPPGTHLWAEVSMARLVHRTLEGSDSLLWSRW